MKKTKYQNKSATCNESVKELEIYRWGICYGPRGGYSSLVLVGMCHQFQNKITRFFQNFLEFEPILAQIWDNFDKLTHSYTKFYIL